jgi:excisionase family DNA binding protein
MPAMSEGKKSTKRRGPNVPGTCRVDEAAARLGVGPKTVYAWIAAGLIPHVRVGRRIVRLRAEHVDAMIRDVPAKYEEPAPG